MENLVPSMPIPIIPLTERLALIHNGIIENYAVLKEKLQAKGYVFKKQH